MKSKRYKTIIYFHVFNIRLTRFSRSSTAGYLEAVRALEEAGAKSYIIDLRNNYGGVIQEALLTASTLLREPSTVLCYTINSRGGFNLHDVEEFVVDSRYPGYFLSTENTDVTLSNVRKTNPNNFWNGYSSLHEQNVKRGTKFFVPVSMNLDIKPLQKHKKLYFLLMKEQLAPLRYLRPVYMTMKEQWAW